MFSLHYICRFMKYVVLVALELELVRLVELLTRMNIGLVGK